MGGSENGGTQQPWVFLLKLTILRCFGGTTIYGNTHIDLHEGYGICLQNVDHYSSPNTSTLPFYIEPTERTPQNQLRECWFSCVCLQQQQQQQLQEAVLQSLLKAKASEAQLVIFDDSMVASRLRVIHGDDF